MYAKNGKILVFAELQKKTFLPGGVKEDVHPVLDDIVQQHLQIFIYFLFPFLIFPQSKLISSLR